MDTPSKSSYTPEEYLALERAVEYKNEYRDGQIYRMPPANVAHNLITVNIGGLLHNQLRERPCQALMSAMRVHVAATGLYT